MTREDITTAMNTQYELSHALHQEAARVRDAHGIGFLDDPHYMVLDAAISGVQASITALRLLHAALSLAEQAAV